MGIFYNVLLPSRHDRPVTLNATKNGVNNTEVVSRPADASRITHVVALVQSYNSRVLKIDSVMMAK